MKSRVLLTLLVAFGWAIIDGPAARAEVDADANWYRTNKPSVDWDDKLDWDVYVPDPGTWVGADFFPKTGDTADILYTHVATLDSAETCGNLRIRSGGTVDTADQTLTIDGTGVLIEPVGLLNVSTGGKVDLTTADAVIQLEGIIELDTSTSILEISVDTFCEGDGRIRGLDADALIELAAGVTFTNYCRIEGSLEIDTIDMGAQATFRNEGLVHANRATTPFIIEVANLKVIGSGEFRVGPQSSLAEIWFTSDASLVLDLSAAFYVMDGTLDIDPDLISVGLFYMENGKVEVADTKTAIFNTR